VKQAKKGPSLGIYQVEFLYSAILHQELTYDENIITEWNQSSMKGQQKIDGATSTSSKATGKSKSKK